MEREETQVAELKEQLQAEQITEVFANSDEKTKFYIGLPDLVMLIHVFRLVPPYIKSSSTCSLSKFQQFILVLMRMRLNVPLQDLAYRFCISLTTVKKVFDRWIDAMHIRMKFLIM